MKFLKNYLPPFAGAFTGSFITSQDFPFPLNLLIAGIVGVFICITFQLVFEFFQ